MNGFTRDTFFNGRLRVMQPASGYRFSIDAVLLANLADVKPGDRILDMGTGCGIIPLVLAYRHPDISRIFGIEIQKELADTANSNILENRMEERISIIHADFKTLMPAQTGGPVDLVICNPPHYPQNSGRINPDDQRALARHEIAMTLDDLIAVSRRMLNRAGRLFMIYPSVRIVDMMTRMRQAGIEPKQLRLIHPRPGAEARLVLAEGIAGRRPGVKIGPPLCIHGNDGKYTPEIETMFSGSRIP